MAELKNNEFLIWESDRLRCVGRSMSNRVHRYRWRITSKHNGKITHASSEAFNSKRACLDNANMICCRQEGKLKLAILVHNALTGLVSKRD